MYYREVIRTLSSFRVNLVIKVLIASDIVVCSAANFVGPIFAIYIADILPGGSIEAVGIASMIYLLVNSFMEIPVAIYIDRSKSEKDDFYSMIVGTLLGAVPFFLYTFINEIWQLYLLQAVSGVAAAIAYPGWSSMFTKHIDKSKSAFEWSLYDVLVGFGMAGAAVAGAFLAERFGFNLVFSLIGVLTVLGAVSLFAIQNKIDPKLNKK